MKSSDNNSDKSTATRENSTSSDAEVNFDDIEVDKLRLKRSERKDYTPDMLLDVNKKPKFSCHRCHRLKKKCSKEFPKCSYCVRTSNDCFYVKRSTKKNNAQTDNTTTEGIKANDLESMKVNWIQKDGEDTTNSVLQLPPIKTILNNNFSVPSLLVDTNQIATRSPNSKDEFINLKSFDDANLPVGFLYNYIHNYENQYPIFDSKGILEEIQKIDFTSESIVGFHIYMILSIGCLITDSSNNSELFDQYFNDNIIESIVDIPNFIYDRELDLYNLKLIILLALYHSHKQNSHMVLNLIILLNKLVIRYDFYKLSHSDPQRNQKLSIFWSSVNLDYEFNFTTNRPSKNSLNLELIIAAPNSKISLLDNSFTNQLIQLHLLQNRLNNLKLVTQITDENFKVNPENGPNIINVHLQTMSKDIEVWRHETYKIMSRAFYHDEEYLKQFDHFVNVNYFYLTIELDQLSTTKSSEFTSQFLYHYFALVLPVDKSKNKSSLSLNNYLNLKKLHNVVTYTLIALKDKNYSTSFKNNISLIITLYQLLYNNHRSVTNELLDSLKTLNDDIHDEDIDKVILTITGIKHV